jgi:uncharacterized protein YybS (DUF2232 family)
MDVLHVIVLILKYAFVVALVVEGLLIVRALVNLAREKSHEAVQAAPAEE